MKFSCSSITIVLTNTSVPCRLKTTRLIQEGRRDWER